jgi:FMN phosphatase YigB (HAD superfamily)
MIMEKIGPLTCVSLLLERLELRGEEVVFLDDIGSNLSAARRAGIHTIKVADVHTAIGQLQVSFSYYVLEKVFQRSLYQSVDKNI